MLDILYQFVDFLNNKGDQSILRNYQLEKSLKEENVKRAAQLLMLDFGRTTMRGQLIKWQLYENVLSIDKDYKGTPDDLLKEMIKFRTYFDLLTRHKKARYKHPRSRKAKLFVDKPPQSL